MDLPAGWTWRRATEDDVAAICDLVIAVDVAEYGEPDYEEADVREDFARARFDLSTDTWCVHDERGVLRGHAAAWDKSPGRLVLGDAFAHPETPHLYPWLVARVGERTQEHADASGECVAHVFNSEPNTDREAALRAAGYEVCRVFRRMAIDLATTATPEPALRPGVVVRPVTPEDLPTCWAVQRESFAEHFDYVAEPYESWHARLVETETYRPHLWWLAEVDGVAAGVLIGQQHEENGWVKTLGVLKSARGRGVGTALLLTAFAAFRAAGMPKAGLGVDSDNSSGAMALYERIGMRAEHRYDCYERVFTRR